MAKNKKGGNAPAGDSSVENDVTRENTGGTDAKSSGGTEAESSDSSDTKTAGGSDQETAGETAAVPAASDKADKDNSSSDPEEKEKKPAEEKEPAKPPVVPVKKKKKGPTFKEKLWVSTKMVLHFTKILFIITLAILIIAGLILGIYHAAKLKSESQYLNMPGKQVEVDGKYIHVITGGNEDAGVTLVFLHGNRISDDSVVFQPLFKQVEKTAAYCYVDRAGTGFSDDSDGGDRDVDSLVTETRKAVEAAGMKAPYILVPEGTSGIMALHWANKYPGEVAGIFGMGMYYPEQFDPDSEDTYAGFGDWLTMVIFKIGAARIFSGMKADDPGENFTEAQMNTRQALIYRGAYTKDMYKEDKAMNDSAATVKAEGWPKDIPIVMLYGNPYMEPYLSLDEEVKAKVEAAKEKYPDVDVVAEYYYAEQELAKQMENVTFTQISGPVRVALYAPKEIGAELKKFVETCLMKQN